MPRVPHKKRLSALYLILLACSLIIQITPTQAQVLESTDSYSAFAATMPTGGVGQRIGIATHPWWLEMHLDTFISNFKQLGVGVVRIPFEWKMIEPQPGQFDWRQSDKLLTRLNDEGFSVVLEFVTMPVWASNNPAECAKYDLNCAYSPLASGYFEQMVEASARRYPFVRHWEFWNEPEQWPNAGRDVSVYGSWLKLFYRAIKRVDPGMLVAACTVSGPEYIGGLYNYIEASSGGKNYPWDAVAYHPYNLDGETDEQGVSYLAKKRIERLHQLMVERGDSNKPIWITEIGFQAPPPDQARIFQASFDWLTARDYITVIALHMLHDWSEEAYGLMATQPETYPFRGDVTPATKFVPKQPYFDTFKNYPKRVLPTTPAANPETLVFSETGHTVRGSFRQAWLNRGGLALFGFPKTGQFYERNAATGQYYLVQYFERVRMEYHPDLQGTPYEVQFGLLGTETMIGRGMLDQQGRPKASYTLAQPPAADPESLFFPETGHNLSGLFLAAWQKQGGLAIIGLPRSAVFEDKHSRGEDGGPLKVQYFERARMELHSGPDGRKYILFGLLSNQRLVEQGRLYPNHGPVSANPYNPANSEFVAVNR